MPKTCDGCGQLFDAVRSDARFCSGRCRTTAYRVRRDGPKPPVKRRPLARDLGSAALELDRVMRRWGRLADDDRFSRAGRKTPQLRERLLRAAGELQKMAEMIEPSHQTAV